MYVPDGCESRHEGALCMDSGADRPLYDAFLRQLVVPADFGIWMQEH